MEPILHPLVWTEGTKIDNSGISKAGINMHDDHIENFEILFSCTQNITKNE